MPIAVVLVEVGKLSADSASREFHASIEKALNVHAMITAMDFYNSKVWRKYRIIYIYTDV